eukprot:352470-Chlamydomonas_euryale.AAC.8
MAMHPCHAPISELCPGGCGCSCGHSGWYGDGCDGPDISRPSALARPTFGDKRARRRAGVCAGGGGGETDHKPPSLHPHKEAGGY